MSKVMCTVRDDGLKIVSKKLAYTNKIMINFVALTGSASDPKDKSGLFHFFEHMAFQGTKTRSAEEISSLLDRLSKGNNANTGIISTEYYAIGIRKNWEKLFEVIADMYTNSHFPKEELEKERQVILREIAMYKDDDTRCVFENLMKALYRNNPAIVDGAGTESGIKNISRDFLIQTHRKFYIPANTLIVVTGNVEHDDVVRLSNLFFKKNFTKLQTKTSWSDEVDELPVQKEIVEERPNRERAIIVLGLKIPNENRRDRILSNILADLIGDGASSPLYKELRQKRGLVYSTQASTYGVDPVFSTMIFYAETLNKDIDEVRKLLLETARTCEISEKTFEEKKEKMLEEATIELETAEKWNKEIFHKIRSGEGFEDLDNYQRKLSKILKGITLADVLDLRERVIKEERVACSILKTK